MVYQNEQAKDIKGSIVFVHGICHGAWCWEKYFVPYFSEHGYECYAVDLQGHGRDSRKRLKGASLSGYVENVKDIVSRCSGKPFLIGHSMGGAVVQQYIGKYADTVSGAVLFASATAPRMPRAKTTLSLVNRNLRYAFYVALGIKGKKGKRAKIVHEAAFFTGENEAGEKVQRIDDTTPYESLLQKEPKRVFLWDLYRNYSKNYKIDVPVFVIGSSADAYFPEESLKKTAQKYAEYKEPAYKCLNYLCHDMMLDPKWKEPAELVRKFIENPAIFIKDHPRPEK